MSFFMGFTTPKPFGQMTVMHSNCCYFTALQNWECIGCVQGVTHLQCAEHIWDTLNERHLLGKAEIPRQALGKKELQNVI